MSPPWREEKTLDMTQNGLFELFLKIVFASILFRRLFLIRDANKTFCWSLCFQFKNQTELQWHHKQRKDDFERVKCVLCVQM